MQTCHSFKASIVDKWILIRRWVIIIWGRVLTRLGIIHLCFRIVHTWPKDSFRCNTLNRYNPERRLTWVVAHPRWVKLPVNKFQVWIGIQIMCSNRATTTSNKFQSQMHTAEWRVGRTQTNMQTRTKKVNHKSLKRTKTNSNTCQAKTTNSKTTIIKI